MTPFTRQLGNQSGVQLNQLRDNTDGYAPDNTDQTFATAMRCTRGRIDRPFAVNNGNFLKKLGRGESLRSSALNEAWIQVGEALQKGAYQAVIQRLITSAAALSYIVASVGTGAVLGAPVVSGGAITSIPVTGGGAGYDAATNITVTGVGTGAVITPTIVAGVITALVVTSGGTGYVTGSTSAAINAPVIYTVSSTVPVTPFLFYFQHLECFNDGLKVQLHADELKSSGVSVANALVTLRLLDPYDSSVLYEFTGSLDSTAKDDYGNSMYLPDVIEGQTQNVALTVGGITAVPVNANCYGRDVNSAAKVAQSATLSYFVEGGTSYQAADYISAITALRQTPYTFGYLASAGSQATALVGQLAAFGIETNTQFVFDVPGNLNAVAAQAWIAQLSLDSHYSQAFWAPLKSNDPMGINGKVIIGTSCYQVARRCQRNAQMNAKGFAPKNFPIGGKAWPLDRTGIVQVYTPSAPEKSDLALAKINPVIWETYNDGGRFVFIDALTCAATQVSYRKLITVAEMSSSLDGWIAAAAKEFLLLPMATCIQKMNDFMKTLLEGAEASDWLVPSDQMGGAAFQYLVQANAQRPADKMDLSYSTHYDGLARQITITQTLSK